MLEKSRSGTRSDDRSSSMSPMSWKRYAASISCQTDGGNCQHKQLSAVTCSKGAIAQSRPLFMQISPLCHSLRKPPEEQKQSGHDKIE